MLAPNASSPCQRVSNGYLCHPLPVPNVAFWPDKKIKKNAAARGRSQRSKTQKMLAPNASSPCQRVSNGYLCHPLPVPNVAFWPDKKIKKNAAACGRSQQSKTQKCWLLTVSACRMVTCVTPCQCLTSLSDPIRKSRKMQLPAAEASGPRPKKCWLLTLHPPVSACRMVTCVTPCQCLTSLSDPIRKPRKMQLPAAEASGPRPKKCWLLTLHPPVSACRLVTCVTPCQCLTSLSDPIRKSRKMQLPAAEASGPSQSSVGRSVCLPACLPLSVCLSACLPAWLAGCLSLSSLRRILLRRAPPASGWGRRINAL